MTFPDDPLPDRKRRLTRPALVYGHFFSRAGYTLGTRKRWVQAKAPSSQRKAESLGLKPRPKDFLCAKYSFHSEKNLICY
jgi:hypothetical protein